MNNRIDSSHVRPEEMALIRAWAHSLITDPGAGSTDGQVQEPGRCPPDLPFSFVCGTRSSREWVKRENAQCESGAWQNGKRLHSLRWHDAQADLHCVMQLTEFSDFPAMEWVVRLRYEGTGETASITQFKALDTCWTCAKDGEMPELRRSYGSDGRYDDFQYVIDELRQSQWDASRTIRMDSANNTAFRKVRSGSPAFVPFIDGRPSTTWLPFFNLRTGGDGILCAVGWGGQWFAEFAHDGKGKTAISAGMEHLDLKLRPGEEIRSPRMLLLYWLGEPIHGHNVLRQFVLQHHSPQVSGRPVEMPVCNGSWGGTPTAGHLETIRTITEQKLAYD